jgi:uncharacterized protein (TIGR02453 family)
MRSQGMAAYNPADVLKSSKESMKHSETKPYFRASALKFLRDLERNNRREWFDPRKPEFERELKEPMLALIDVVTQSMAQFAPAHVRPPQKCMMRIYRDTRFSSDKRPYKTQVAAWWSREGLEKTSGGGYYFHVSSKEVVIAAGVYMPQREQLLAIRSFLLEHHSRVRALLEDKKLRKVMGSFEGVPLSRPPKGFPKDHPAMDLLLCRQWGVAATLGREVALDRGFAREVVKRFRLAAPLVDALNSPLLVSSRAKRRPLFGLDSKVHNRL